MLKRIKRSPALAAIVGLVLVAALAFGWWTVSPLFIKTTLVEGQNISVAAAKPDSAVPEAAKPGDPIAEAAGAGDTRKADVSKGPSVVSVGSFSRIDDLHYASGQAVIARQEDGSYILRLQDLDAANGPDLYVYLSENPNPANSSDVHQGEHNLGTLKAAIGSFSYIIDPSVDVSKVKSVVIYCRAFSVIFSVASLQADQ